MIILVKRKENLISNYNCVHVLLFIILVYSCILFSYFGYPFELQELVLVVDKK